LRIALVTAIPLVGVPEIGSAYYSRALAERLQQTGQKVEIWTKDIGVEPAPSSVNIFTIWRPGISAWIDILRACLKRKPDVLHIQHAMFLLGNGAVGEIAMVLLLLSLIIARQKVVITCHDTPELRQITSAYMRMHKYRFPVACARFGLRMLFWLIGRCAQIVIVHQQHFAQTLSEDYGIAQSRIAVVPLLAIPCVITSKPEARKELSLSFDRKYLLFFGFATGYKGIEELLDAMRILQARFPEMELLLGAGEHPKVKDTQIYREYYANLRAQAERTGNVRFLGFIPDERLDCLIDAIDLAIFPYVEFQGMSGPLNQCAAHRRPFLVSGAIATKIPALNAVSFQQDPQAIAGAIERYFTDSRYANEVSGICGRFGDVTCSDDFLDLTLDIYRHAQAFEFARSNLATRD
jgi:glycosyltransferase involved in cell wall biosynthesis